MKNIKEGWPEKRSKVSELVAPYWFCRYELVEVNGIIFKGEQIVIPSIMRLDMLERLHYNHMVIEKTKLRTRELIFWPGIEKDISEKVKNCPACLTYHNSQRSEPLLNRELPNIPWTSVDADLFHYQGLSYLLIVDLYSKYPEICSLNRDTTHENVVKHVKSVFSRHGKPQIFYSDNGPQFVNKNFHDFLSTWEIQHITSTPTYPQSNGFVERHIQTIKNLLKKTLFEDKDLYLTLLEYRNTPIAYNIPSPAQLLFGHLPIPEKRLQPQSL